MFQAMPSSADEIAKGGLSIVVRGKHVSPWKNNETGGNSLASITDPSTG